MLKSRIRVVICFLLITLYIMTSCASTTLTAVWKDDSHEGHIKKVLVMGVSERPALRRSFETEFVRQLQARGTDAVSSYTIFPSKDMVEINSISSKMKDLGIDAVLITRLVDKKTVDTYVPGRTHYAPPAYYGNWSGYYRASYGAAYEPGYTVRDEVVVLETNVYDVSTEKLIWSAISETFVEGSDEKLIKELIKLITDNLSKQNVLG